MARAETIETAGENEVGGNGPFPCHSTCRMEVPRPLHAWPNALITAARTPRSGSGVGAAYLRHHHLHLEPFQALNLLSPLPPPHPHLEPRQAPPSPPPPPSPASERRGESGRRTDAASDSRGECSDSDRDKEDEDNPDVSRRRGPLPDLLPQNEHLSRASVRRRGPGREAALELDIRRVAGQLRVIGDEFNAAVLRRAYGAPHWRDWRDVCRGLLSFITQTLSTLYRLT
ncbi:uncharacterized protein LOC108247883 [Kryptolebias marmoratus]|uniref:uncharacterized protein LOC108247883 n=1 Tax=Kryptolebias marmoratus TaxID=37003 RepID=UPI0007F90D40|nr:uncharacterized protein LOC108247883 [Kryptolebias marmoratus]